MSKTSALEQSYADNTPMSPEEYIGRRHETSRNRANRLVTAVTIGALAVVAGVKTADLLTQPDARTVVETVQPGENPWIIAQKAEEQYGHDKQDYSVRDEARRLAEKYGILQPGERIQVRVR
jgi:phage gp16-like protein